MLHRKKTPNSGNSLACLESMTQPDWKPIQLTAGTNNQCALSTDTNTNSFSPTSTHSYIYLARHDFLLVFHSNLWSRWNSNCGVISRSSQQDHNIQKDERYRYQIRRHIGLVVKTVCDVANGYEQLAQSHYAAAPQPGVEPATS